MKISNSNTKGLRNFRSPLQTLDAFFQFSAHIGAVIGVVKHLRPSYFNIIYPTASLLGTTIHL